MKPILLITVMLALLSPVWAQSGDTTDAKSAVPALLNAQRDAWNRGDLEGYMAGYWNSPELTFFAGATETHGWQAALERYRRAYKSAGKEMGHLEFTDLRVESLAPDAAFARGQWHLTMTNGKAPHGVFTLVLKRFPEGWKIIHDHSSGE